MNLSYERSPEERNSEEKNLPVIESRRSFLGACLHTLAGITIVGAAAPLFQACEPTLTMPAPGNNNNNPGQSTNGGLAFDVSALTANGQALTASARGASGASIPILIIRQSETTYVTLSMVCTHQGCLVDPPPAGGPITCVCHGSRFDLSGSVLNGPADQPLKQYQTTYDATTKKVTVKLQ